MGTHTVPHGASNAAASSGQCVRSRAGGALNPAHNGTRPAARRLRRLNFTQMARRGGHARAQRRARLSVCSLPRGSGVSVWPRLGRAHHRATISPYVSQHHAPPDRASMELSGIAQTKCCQHNISRMSTEARTCGSCLISRYMACRRTHSGLSFSSPVFTPGSYSRSGVALTLHGITETPAQCRH